MKGILKKGGGESNKKTEKIVRFSVCDLRVCKHDCTGGRCARVFCAAEYE